MKIVFLCGSLEPGRNGVGDYVARLANELVHEGHEILSVSLNDHYINQGINDIQRTKFGNLQTLRIPAKWSTKKRFDRARQCINDFEAEWISLQFVPFSFHSKGLSFALAKHLADLGKGKSWHIMIHELWIGMDRESSFKHKVWGYVQRVLIQMLLARLSPNVIHTQTNIYQAQLAKLGFKSIYLPLFSNIPITSANSITTLNFSEKKPISLVLFGGIHSGAPVEQFAREVADYSTRTGISVTLLMIGRHGREHEHWATQWKAVGLPVEIVGEQMPAEISTFLTNATLGIATTPALLLGKSGTAAAMQEHGLKVLCVAREWTPNGIDIPESLIKAIVYQEGNFEKYLNEGKSMQETNKVSIIAKQFLNDLLYNM